MNSSAGPTLGEREPVSELVPEPTKLGIMQRKVANLVTRGRTFVAAGVFTEFVAESSNRITEKLDEFVGWDLPDLKTWGAGAVVLALGALDKVDGFLGRRSQKNGVPITKRERDMDPFHDKIFAHMAMGSIALRGALDLTAQSYSEKDLSKAMQAGVLGIIALNQVVTGGRDYFMTKSRQKAVEGADTSAIFASKLKTGIQNIGHAAAVSPLGLGVAAGIYTLTSGIALTSYFVADRKHRGEQYTGFWSGLRRTIRGVPINAKKGLPV